LANAARQKIAATYIAALKDSDVVLPVIRPDAESVWHLFVIRVSDRQALQNHLKSQGISSGVHYPIPLHQQPAYKYLQMPQGSLPITEKATQEIVSLPLYAELTDEMVAQVVQSISEYLSQSVVAV
jgi:dTDP-4-amino-4,6-dideoxygalactose transaminase